MTVVLTDDEYRGLLLRAAKTDKRPNWLARDLIVHGEIPGPTDIGSHEAKPTPKEDVR